LPDSAHTDVHSLHRLTTALANTSAAGLLGRRRRLLRWWWRPLGGRWWFRHLFWRRSLARGLAGWRRRLHLDSSLVGAVAGALPVLLRVLAGRLGHRLLVGGPPEVAVLAAAGLKQMAADGAGLFCAIDWRSCCSAFAPEVQRPNCVAASWRPARAGHQHQLTDRMCAPGQRPACASLKASPAASIGGWPPGATTPTALAACLGEAHHRVDVAGAGSVI
jgi:hypothetical protein